MKLKNLTSIVTGGGKDIGRAITLVLAREGADVAIVALNDLESAEATVKDVKEIGSQAIALKADITDKESVSKMVHRVLETFGKVDLLVNNAGASARAPLEQLSVENWDKVIAVNLKGVFLCSVAVAKEMMKQKRDGNIINIGGASGHRCYGGGGAYGPSKAAVISLTKQMAVEWAKYNIRVNGVSPGPILTPRSIKRMRDDEDNKRRIEKILPLGRAGRPEEVAEAVLFLASESSSYITGQMIIVDGGGVETWYLYP